MRVFATLCLLTCLGLTGCSPAEGSPAWCKRMMNQPQSSWTFHKAEVFAARCQHGLDH